MASPRDVLIVGAGPAGLAAAKACLNLGLDVEIVEQGKDITARDKDAPGDAVTGLGGAGLFSDGKFSFYPSASQLWNLQTSKDLAQAYEWFSELVRLGGLEPEPLPELVRNPIGPSSTSSRFERKYYPSYYIPFLQRLRLIETLVKGIPVISLCRVPRSSVAVFSLFSVAG